MQTYFFKNEGATYLTKEMFLCLRELVNLLSAELASKKKQVSNFADQLSL
jgi:hypothetical protein